MSAVVTGMFHTSQTVTMRPRRLFQTPQASLPDSPPLICVLTTRPTPHFRKANQTHQSKMFECPAHLQTHIRPQKLFQYNVMHLWSPQGMSTGSSEGRHIPMASICTDARRTRGPMAPQPPLPKGNPEIPGLVWESSMPYPAGIGHTGRGRLNW